jgi:PIN domain nuclease of toxin-antitoxin system
MYAAEAVYNGFVGYSKITASLTSDRDLAAIAQAIGAPFEVIKEMHDRADGVIPPWEAMSHEQQERFANSEELDELGFLVLQAIKYALNPAQREADEAAEALHRHTHDPLDKLIDALSQSSGDLTIIRGRIR